MPQDVNLRAYEQPSTVEYYRNLQALQECESFAFEKYVSRGTRVLDIGVGGGRTTPFLSTRASRYVGIDYSAEMVKTCQQRFPGLGFQRVDASEMSCFESASFDRVVFSFNGMDSLHPAGKRERCLSEIARVLAPQGILLFSVHNSSSVLVRPKLRGAGWVRGAWRCLRAVMKSAELCARVLPTRAFWTGEGYVDDPVHGGLKLRLASPEKVVAETGRFGFKLLEVIGGHHPAHAGSLTTPWYYYAFRKG